MTTQTHGVEFTDDGEGFDVAVCACGWQSEPVPGTDIAGDCWGAHLLASVDVEVDREIVRLRDALTHIANGHGAYESTQIARAALRSPDQGGDR